MAKQLVEIPAGSPLQEGDFIQRADGSFREVQDVRDRQAHGSYYFRWRDVPEIPTNHDVSPYELKAVIYRLAEAGDEGKQAIFSNTPLSQHQLWTLDRSQENRVLLHCFGPEDGRFVHGGYINIAYRYAWVRVDLDPASTEKLVKSKIKWTQKSPTSWTGEANRQRYDVQYGGWGNWFARINQIAVIAKGLSSGQVMDACQDWHDKNIK